MNFKFTVPKPPGYTMTRGNTGGYYNFTNHKRHPKMIIELHEMLQMIWESLPRKLIDKAVKKFPK